MSDLRLVLVRRGGEVATKARATRARFEARLLRNLRDALAREGVDANVRHTHDRILVGIAASRSQKACEVLSRVFGVQSLSVAIPRPCSDLDALVEHGVELFSEAVRGRRFAVRARRVGDRSRIPMSARAVEHALGAALLPLAERVDLDRPEVTVGIELHEASVHFFRERVPGPGGLPLGIGGRAVALVSGGFDSAVAAWRMQRRGIALDHVFCNLGGATHQLGVLRVMKVLGERWSYGTRPRLHAVDFEAVGAQLRERTRPCYWQVLLKRLMLRAAESVGRAHHSRALVTGESVGQVSSQTLANLAVISHGAELPILRPLVGSNKDEIIAEAERIGTGPLSAAVAEYCAMVPRRPATHAGLRTVLEEEAKLDPDLLRKAVQQRRVFDLLCLDPEELAIPALDVEAIPEGAQVIDLRSQAAYQGWHYPGALHLDFARASSGYRSFAREATYVLYCEFGLKSAHLAERMQKEGLRAFHFPGGLKPLLRHARARGLAPSSGLDPTGLT